MHTHLQAALPVSAETTAAIVGALSGAEAAAARQAGPGAFVAFSGTAALYASLLSSRTPPGTLALAAASAAALAATYQRAQVGEPALPCMSDNLSMGIPCGAADDGCR